MRIYIEEEGKKMFIPLPTPLVFNSFILWIIKRKTIKIKGVDMSNFSARSMRNIRRTVRRMKRIHKGLYLVEVEDGNSTVKIKL